MKPRSLGQTKPFCEPFQSPMSHPSSVIEVKVQYVDDAPASVRPYENPTYTDQKPISICTGESHVTPYELVFGQVARTHISFPQGTELETFGSYLRGLIVRKSRKSTTKTSPRQNLDQKSNMSRKFDYSTRKSEIWFTPLRKLETENSTVEPQGRKPSPVSQKIIMLFWKQRTAKEYALLQSHETPT